jgi:hypothetical protein
MRYEALNPIQIFAVQKPDGAETPAITAGSRGEAGGPS